MEIARHGLKQRDALSVYTCKKTNGKPNGMQSYGIGIKRSISYGLLEQKENCLPM